MQKSPFSNCAGCPLKDQIQVLGETNSKDDLSKIELLILAEAPAKEETEQGRPLVGQAGRVFREVFSRSGLSEIPHYISNIVMCANLHKDVKTGNIKTNNPPKEAVELCKPNWMKLVEILNPKIILIMGDFAKEAFGISGSVTNGRGMVHECLLNKDDFMPTDVFLTIHPSYVLRNGGLKTDTGRLLLDDFKAVLKILRPNTQNTNQKKINKTTLKLSDPYYHNISNDLLSTTDKRLINIQKDPITNKIVFTMRDTSGKKHYTMLSDQAYHYRTDDTPGDGPMLCSASEAEIVINQLPNEDYSLYESDVKNEYKYAIDYYLKRKAPEPIVPLKIMFFDIEVYNEGSKRFPDPKIAKKPINAISFKVGGGLTNIYLVPPKGVVVTDEMKGKLFELGMIPTTFENEHDLLLAFCEAIKNEDPDLLAGWNSIGFDIIYIYNRMKANRINSNLLSPLGSVMINPNKYGEVYISGLYVLDMLQLFKDFSMSVRATYKLGAIASEILGEGKVEYQGSLDELYTKDIFNFIRYSGQDTRLLKEIADKTGHVELRDELRRICCSTWGGSETTTGLIDPLCISYAKRRGLICRTSEQKKHAGGYAGAYVREPVSGLHTWLIDLDFRSMYPYIIISCNIGPDTYIGRIDGQIAFNYIYKKELLPNTIDVTLNPIQTSGFHIESMSKDKFIKFIEDNDAIITVAGTIYMGHSKKISFFNLVLSDLLGSRDKYKSEMKKYKNSNESEYKRLYNIQWAYKILANSIYGVLGNAGFRMFKIDLAKSVTLTGQELAKFAGHHLSKYLETGSLDVDTDFLENYDDNKPYLAYQDTDSVFLQIGDYLNDQKRMI